MENELVTPLLRRKNQLFAEIKKIDDLLALYEIKPNNEDFLLKKLEAIQKMLKYHHEIAKADLETYLKLDDGTFVPVNAQESYAESGFWEETEAALISINGNDMQFVGELPNILVQAPFIKISDHSLKCTGCDSIVHCLNI